jgi:hypothetical protein
MTTLTGRVSKYDASNVTIGGKIIFIPPEDRKAAQTNFPVGIAAKIVVEKGIAKGMVKLTADELKKFESEEMAAKSARPATQPLKTPVVVPPVNKELPKESSCTSPEATPLEQVLPANEIEEFKNILLSTNRDGMGTLIEYLDSTDFFIAPSSTKYHDAQVGGLLHHSLKVYHNLSALLKIYAIEIPDDSLAIISLLHDLCKANIYKRERKSLPRRDEKTGELVLDDWGKKIWDETFVYTVDDPLPLGHGEKSVIVIQRYIQLTDIEIFAIRWHMMAYDDSRNSYAGNLAITNASDKYRIIPLVHAADLLASFLEMRPVEGVV